MIPSIPLIRVHDSVAVREYPNHGYDFSKNGLRIINPLSCTVTEELNGLYICEMEHHIDDAGNWLTLKENNILSVPILYHDSETNQLFRITKREHEMSENGEKIVKITASHIFYDLNARAIMKASFENLNCFNSILSVSNQLYIVGGVGGLWYPYSFNSNITEPKSAEYENTTLTAALIGEDNSICNLYGGELYRDNFYFSINKVKEGSIHHPVPIKYGTNMVSIKETADWTEYCNYVHAYDNFGNWYDVSYTEFYSSLGHIVRSIQCNYQESDYERLVEDAIAYFTRYSTPDINYEVRFDDISGYDTYGEFLKLKKYEVGDTVDIINERLNITTNSKIIRKVYDVLRRKTIEIELGSQKGSIVKRDFLSDTVFRSSNDVKALQRSSVASKDTRYIVNLTEDEYEGIQNKDPETLYIVTDDQV